MNRLPSISNRPFREDWTATVPAPSARAFRAHPTRFERVTGAGGDTRPPIERFQLADSAAELSHSLRWNLVGSELLRVTLGNAVSRKFFDDTRIHGFGETQIKRSV